MSSRFDTQSLKNRMQEIAQRELGKGQEVAGLVKYFCPFHRDGTSKNPSPSFVAYADHFHCFGCSANGDVIEFIMKLKGLNFVEACKSLDAGETTTEAIQTFKVEREAARKLQAETREKMRQEYAQSREYEQYRDMGPGPINQWEKWGVNQEWRDFWKVGYTPEKRYRVNESDLSSPAYVMPIHSPLNGKPPMVITSQFRLTNPAEGAGKFRFEYKSPNPPGLGTAPFIARHDWKMGYTPGKHKTCLVVEGPRKAATTYAQFGIADDCLQIIGIPSKCDSGGSLEAFKLYEWVYVWLDPDVVNRPQNAGPNWEPSDIRLCRLIGVEKTSFVRYPLKIDDAILDNVLKFKDFRRLLSLSARVEV